VKRSWIVGLAFAALHSVAAHAQNPQPTDPKACIGIETDSQRLACYDRVMGRTDMPGVQAKDSKAPAATVQAVRQSLFSNDTTHYAQAGAADTPAPVSLLDSRWELDPKTKLGTFNVRGYKPVYLLPVFYTSNVNNRPTSPAPGHVTGTSLDYDKLEAKFQLSLKTKVWQGVFGDAGDLWVAYTQSSRWQVYNHAISRPFRETNYEPEAMLVFNTNYDVGSWKGRLLGIGVDHQSNGRPGALSRSWNRVIADIGFEHDGWTVMLRPWWRIPESRGKDDNPDIEDYMGRGEIQIVRETGNNEFGLMLRHSLRGGARSHGAMQFTWSFPVAGKLRGYMEIFHGYGESLIDYNHRATYVGVGVSLLNWY
jgi:phospholipase A1